MRISDIEIQQWRHFRNLKLYVDEDAGLVCIVGANGTGKSHILELIAACAHRLGLAQGIEIPRGDPFSDPHSFCLRFHVAAGVSGAIDLGLAQEKAFGAWDRTLYIEDRNIPPDHISRISAGGINDPQQSLDFAQKVIEQLNNSKEVHFLSLDADRAYPKKNINVNEIAQAYEIDWEGAEYTKGRSYRPSTTLYDEWIKYFLAQENQSGTKLMQANRRALKQGRNPPPFEDHFEAYAHSLQKVLPHLLFTGVDSKKRTLLFDTTGLELSFNQLSGGEREIAFLIGQIDRFSLRQGVFLLDEPELHLNADLIRVWVAYLVSTVSAGQIWLATHSLEAVEAAGQHATFVLERNSETREVDSLARLDSRPILAVLSRAVGTPAFSISQLKFVFVEGEDGIGERERFNKLEGTADNIRFMECGSCQEVIRRVSAIKSLANETDATIRIGGVIDKDFRSDLECKRITTDYGVFVLPVHEVENFFLHPETLHLLATQNGKPEINVLDLIREIADRRAGAWVFQNAMSKPNAIGLTLASTISKEMVKKMTWAEMEVDQEALVERIGIATGMQNEELKRFTQLLQISINSYSRKREDLELWKVCEGKQLLNDISSSIGFSGPQDLARATFVVWSRDGADVPDELTALRNYLSAL